MRGHEPLIALRRRGQAPASVWFNVGPADAMWRDWHVGSISGAARIWVQPADSVPLLDLRFVVGLQCWVDGNDARRVLQLHEACVQAKASRVLTAVHGRDSRGQPTVVRMLDTAGLCVMEAA